MRQLALIFLITGLLQAPADSATPGDPTLVTDGAERARIEQALPDQAIARPLKPRKLLIFELNVNYGGHPSIHHASYAFARMGEKTHAFETVISKDPAMFERDTLKQFDAVFFNNNVGNLFTNSTLRENLAEFVYSGGGLMGVHGTAVAFTQWPGGVEDWPEFGAIIGGRGANHKDSTEHVFIKLDEPNHPINQVFGGKGFEYRDEFFRVHEPYSRNKLRVLFSIDTVKTDVNAGQPRGACFREDNDYALAWIRGYGRGRAFYCTIAHNPYVFWDPKMLEFYFAALQFALGDLAAPTTPSSQLTPAVRALEKLGWQLGWQPAPDAKQTLFDAIDRAAKAGVTALSALETQMVSPATAVAFGPGLTTDQRKQVRLKLDAAGLRLLTLRVEQMPGDEPGCRQLFDFARRMGIETIVAAPSRDRLDLMEKLCGEYEMNLALAPDRSASSAYSRPNAALGACANRSRRVGVAADLAGWLRSGIDPAAAASELKDRLMILRLDDLDQAGSQGHSVTWGTGAAKMTSLLQTLQRSGARPIFFAPDADSASPAAKNANVQFFNQAALELAK